MKKTFLMNMKGFSILIDPKANDILEGITVDYQKERT